MHRHTGGFANGHETWHNRIRIAAFFGQHFAVIVGWDAAHVVVNGWEHGDGLAAQIDARKNLGAFRDARQTLRQNLRVQVIEMQIDVIGISADTAAFADLNSHRTRDHVARCKVFGVRRVTLHEALAL